MSPRRSSSGITPSIQYLQVLIVICFYFVSVLLYEDYSKKGTISTFIERYSSVITNAESAHTVDELQKKPNTKHGKNSKQRKLINRSGHDIPGFHSKKTKFVNSGISAEIDETKKLLGIKANRDITKYEILLVEEPLVLVPDYDIETLIPVIELSDVYHDIVEKQKAVDPEFGRIWNKETSPTFSVYEKYASAVMARGMSLDDVRGLDDLAKVHSNQFGIIADMKPSGVYSVLSKFNFILPQNVAALFGEKGDNFVCVVIATKHIKKGEELGFDYYYDWSDPRSVQDPDTLFGRIEYGKEFGFDLNAEWMKMTLDLNADDVSDEEKDRILYGIYADGIIAKVPEMMPYMVQSCYKMNVEDCKRRNKLKQFIENGELFDLVKGRSTRVPLWAGKEFAEAVKTFPYL